MDAKSKMDTFFMTIKNNFEAENTTLVHFGISSFMPLELFYINNLLNRSIWNRYFFNEKFYVNKKDEAKALTPEQFNL